MIHIPTFVIDLQQIWIYLSTYYIDQHGMSFSFNMDD